MGWAEAAGSVAWRLALGKCSGARAGIGHERVMGLCTRSLRLSIPHVWEADGQLRTVMAEASQDG